MTTTTKVHIDDIVPVPAMQRHGSARLRTLLAGLTEPYVLFPALTLLVLAVIWSATWNLIKVEVASADIAAIATSRELVNTYEAQVVRALREIDQTLKLVKYGYETEGAVAALSNLEVRALLPPNQLFAVWVVNSNGAVVASNRSEEIPPAGVRDYLSVLRGSDELWIDQPRKNSASQDWTLQFARRLNAKDGAYAGTVLLAVDASYFVSGYDPAQLGKRGTLGLLGEDGVFWARRTGDTLTAGDIVNYATTVRRGPEGDLAVSLTDSSWDGIRRYTGTQQLVEFPLAVVVGLSEGEQLAVAHLNTHVYLWRAAIGSGVLVLLTTLLGRMSWHLVQGRAREGETKLRHAQRVEYLAYHDGLTGLPNRSMFSRVLSQSISEAHRYERRLAVAFLDLDRFKQINDTLGHEAGDQLLKEVATRLKGCVRESDTVARLGGDEFVVLLPELQDEQYASIVAQKILAATARPFILMSQEFRVTASIGISTYPQDGLDEQTLTKNADIAMYQAKAEGKNNFQFYSEKLNANSLERLTLESSLRHALERNEFRLHYQAKREIASGKITGMEALLRWEHPDLGTVAPMQFIPVAEETGLIVPIGKWVLKTVCLQSIDWQKQGLPPLSIAVNLTARQFLDEQLITDVSSILVETGMDPHLLELELNESVLIHDVENTLRILTGLKALGIRIAVDDFGTGYSSLAMLQRFPLDTIKIDRSLMHDCLGTADETGLADAIIAMGKTLSLTVVAQGVETKEQADHLRLHACDELQGFYFKKPLPVDEFTQLMRDQATEITYTGKRLGIAAAAV